MAVQVDMTARRRAVVRKAVLHQVVNKAVLMMDRPRRWMTMKVMIPDLRSNLSRIKVR
jgi:hypothetical protein